MGLECLQVSVHFVAELAWKVLARVILEAMLTQVSTIGKHVIALVTKLDLLLPSCKCFVILAGILLRLLLVNKNHMVAEVEPALERSLA